MQDMTNIQDIFGLNIIHQYLCRMQNNNSELQFENGLKMVSSIMRINKIKINPIAHIL